VGEEGAKRELRWGVTVQGDMAHALLRGDEREVANSGGVYREYMR